MTSHGYSAAAPAPERSAAVRVAALTAGAFVLYGAWAMYANHAHGLPIALRAFVVQGTSSALSTLFLSALIEWILTRARNAAGLVLAAFGPPSITGAVHISGHTLNGTPRLWATVSVPLAMGYVFAALYVWARRRRGKPLATR